MRISLRWRPISILQPLSSQISSPNLYHFPLNRPQGRQLLAGRGPPQLPRPVQAALPHHHTRPGKNCIKIDLSGKSILVEYFQEIRTSRRPFLLLRISFPARPIFIQLPPGHERGQLSVLLFRRDGRLHATTGSRPGTLFSRKRFILSFRLQNCLSFCLRFPTVGSQLTQESFKLLQNLN